MKKLFCLLCLLLCACQTPNPLKKMQFQQLSAQGYTLFSTYKIEQPGAPLKVYIEGDGHAFDKNGLPTDDPTPTGTFMRSLAAEDPSPNVVYLARPCQYIRSRACTQKDWTTGRFSPTLINSMEAAVSSLMRKARTQEVVLIGYSGGAMMASQIAAAHPQSVKKLITIAGVLNHGRWTRYHGDPPLVDSVDLNITPEFLKIPQVHYLGEKDPVVPPSLTQEILPSSVIVVVKKATHDSGFDDIYKDIWSE